jgi:hypothetical protein
MARISGAMMSPKGGKMKKDSHTHKRYGWERYPHAPEEYHEAFENSVTFAVTGVEGSVVVASMREHWCRRVIASGPPGAMSVEEAISLCEEVCYGPLTKEIVSRILRERCCSDAPGEIDQALRLLGGAGAW